MIPLFGNYRLISPKKQAHILYYLIKTNEEQVLTVL